MRVTIEVQWDDDSEVTVVEQGPEVYEMGVSKDTQQSYVLNDVLTRAVGKVLKAHRPE